MPPEQPAPRGKASPRTATGQHAREGGAPAASSQETGPFAPARTPLAGGERVRIRPWLPRPLRGPPPPPLAPVPPAPPGRTGFLRSAARRLRTAATLAAAALAA